MPAGKKAGEYEARRREERESGNLVCFFISPLTSLLKE
jgi:hypothetical protein